MDFAVPELGEGVYEAELVSWHVKPGDTVKRGQTLMEVLTDKATMEVPSPFAGTITSLSAKPGQQVKVGEAVLAYDPAGQAEPAPASRLPEPAPAASGNGNGAVARPAAPLPVTVRAAPVGGAAGAKARHRPDGRPGQGAAGPHPRRGRGTEGAGREIARAGEAAAGRAALRLRAARHARQAARAAPPHRRADGAVEDH